MKTIVLNIPTGNDIGSGLKKTASSAASGMRSGTRTARTKLSQWIAPKPTKPAKKKVAKKRAKK